MNIPETSRSVKYKMADGKEGTLFISASKIKKAKRQALKTLYSTCPIVFRL